MTKERLLVTPDGHYEDISVRIIGDQNTVLIEDRFPLPDYSGVAKEGVAQVWLTVSEARGLRDWLNKAVPNE